MLVLANWEEMIDDLLVMSSRAIVAKMYEAEFSLQKVGVVAKEDYSYVDWVNIAIQIEKSETYSNTTKKY